MDDCCDLCHKKFVCHRGVCASPAMALRRINGQVQMASSMRTMRVAAKCVPVKKDPKFFSYDRVYLRRRACATKP